MQEFAINGIHTQVKVSRLAQLAAFLHTAPLLLMVFHEVELFLVCLIH